MRIACVHGVDGPGGEAGRPSAEAVALVTEGLRRAGHVVEPVPLVGPLSRVVARLEAGRPQLVLPLAAGGRGPARRALLPALLDALGLPYVGADAFVAALAADKGRTKHALATLGVPTPRAAFVRDLSCVGRLSLAFPVVLKPAGADPAVGITQRSVVERPAALGARLAETLTHAREGVLVEEYVDGRDVVVPFVERASPETGGVLPPCVVAYPEAPGQRWPILDAARRRAGFAALDVRAPADLSVAQTTALRRLSRLIVEALGLRDFGALTYRVTDDGRVWFLDVDTTPDLDAGAPLYHAAALTGLERVDALLDTIVRGAVERSRR